MWAKLMDMFVVESRLLAGMLKSGVQGFAHASTTLKSEAELCTNITKLNLCQHDQDQLSAGVHGARAPHKPYHGALSNTCTNPAIISCVSATLQWWEDPNTE